MQPEQDAISIFSPLVEHAIELAAQWHDGVYRKSCWRDPAFEAPADAVIQVPVIAHVTMVATLVQRAGWGDATVAAAYLHDVIEDMNQHGQHLRRDQLREALGAEVVAEGIENEAQLEHLVALGCRVGQGFLFDRPMAPEAFADLLRRTSR